MFVFVLLCVPVYGTLYQTLYSELDIPSLASRPLFAGEEWNIFSTQSHTITFPYVAATITRANDRL
jgi:hypothetical protein